LASRNIALGGKSWGYTTISSSSSMQFSPSFFHAVITLPPTNLHLPSRWSSSAVVPCTSSLFLPFKVKFCESFLSFYFLLSPSSFTMSSSTFQIRRRSQAGRAGLRERDQLLAINGVSCTSLSHASAMNLIDASGNQLVLTLRRYGLISFAPRSRTLIACLSSMCHWPGSATNKYQFLLLGFCWSINVCVCLPEDLNVL
jgi:hypothetical protein